MTFIRKSYQEMVDTMLTVGEISFHTIVLGSNLWASAGGRDKLLKLLSMITVMYSPLINTDMDMISGN